ncbi:VOC family protein [Agromyces sp. MMS24-K17]|uniref:VOC family protein n=1 Tax=Agromyces sp. MMS24-K17 TaxID=3372850 RepID=UPI00375422F0
MEFRRLAHVAFSVRDLEASLAFYCGGLGMQEKFRISYGAMVDQVEADLGAGNPKVLEDRALELFRHYSDQPWLVYLEVAPSQFLELFPSVMPETLPADLTPDYYAHFCLEVDDIEVAWAEASERGLEPGPIAARRVVATANYYCGSHTGCRACHQSLLRGRAALGLELLEEGARRSHLNRSGGVTNNYV